MARKPTEEDGLEALRQNRKALFWIGIAILAVWIGVAALLSLRY